MIAKPFIFFIFNAIIAATVFAYKLLHDSEQGLRSSLAFGFFRALQRFEFLRR